ncbi:MAG: TM2 domain-containing protein [Burkholderiales bacterium]|nr:TM2 domain-containing protein [Burkholderiales bacterium]MDE1929849.1 TM2 domain-containing protein [Burkholderiales bacterium]MDE2159352.1 TM2 domain-containing protein [Burkholderiales bacterium]MDE2504913.1 TM2 domain-containing protein [Burkholderiales bacterium]
MSPRSKTVAAWLAVLLGTLGAHRVYLHGWGDRWARLFPLPTLVGLYGAWRIDQLGQDDRLSWVLTPVLGLMITVAMLSAIVIALTPDERWNERFNVGRTPSAGGWGAVLAAIAALLIGGGVLMATIAFSAQRYFESQLEAPADAAAPSPR